METFATSQFTANARLKLKLVLFFFFLKKKNQRICFPHREGEGRFAMAAVAVLRNETLQAFLQVCA